MIEFPSLQGRVGGIYADKAGAGAGRRAGRSPSTTGRSRRWRRCPRTLAGAPGRRRREDRQHRRRLDRRREAVGLARPLRAAPRRHGHRAHRPRVRPAPSCRATLADPRFAVYVSGARADDERRAVTVAPRSPPSSGSACRRCCSTRACRSRWSRRRRRGARRRGRRALAARPPAAAAADLPRVAALARAFARSNTSLLQRRRDRLHAAGRAGRQGRGRARRRAGRARPRALRRRGRARPGGGPGRGRAGPLATALAGGDVEAALLRRGRACGAPVDRYFDEVLVMDKDPAVRANRLAQLRRRSPSCSAASATSAGCRSSRVDEGRRGAQPH